MKKTGLITWALLRLPILAAGLYLCRSQLSLLIEKYFNLGQLIEFLVYVYSTAWLRAWLCIPYLILLIFALMLIRKWVTRDFLGYVLFLCGSLALADFSLSYIFKASDALLRSFLFALFLAANAAPDSWLEKLIRGGRISVNLFFLFGVGFCEVMFPQAYFYWLLDRIQSNRPNKKWSWFAGVFIACFSLIFLLVPYNNQRILTLGEKLHPNPAVEKIAEGGYNWIEFNPKQHLLYAVGHNVNYVLAYDTDHLGQPPRRSITQSGKPQSFGFNPDLQELYVYRADTHELLYLDAASLEVTRSLPIADLSPGDVWVNWQRGTDSITIASEADREVGTPFIMLDRPSGTMLASMPLPLIPTNVAFNPDKNIFYFNSFKDTYLVAWDMISHQVMHQIETSPRTDRLVYWPNGDEILVASPQDGAVLRYEAKTLAYKGRIETSLGARTLTLDTKRNLLLVGNFINNHMQVIDMNTYKPVASYYIGPWIRTIALDLDGGVAYVSTIHNLFRVEYTAQN